ncbi:DUF4148 domain-containing protein [Paraburkholderia acidipaludis]|uniref:DUF4148 domain-containing protein n=1 Tax=Paraburkholderia acidipaludis TaxID=660537 RepID=UPI00048960AF|nr:DUF4148 domain-containing protein [Paraburkholderia acidipaludis]
MKSLFKAVVLAVAVTAPLVSFAQTAQPLSRGEVRADLVRAEQAGYNPNDWLHYPENLQAAQARIAANNDKTTYGAGTNGSSQAGRQAEVTVSPYSPPVEVKDN